LSSSLSFFLSFLSFLSPDFADSVIGNEVLLFLQCLRHMSPNQISPDLKAVSLIFSGQSSKRKANSLSPFQCSQRREWKTRPPLTSMSGRGQCAGRAKSDLV
jgi:hypothetical protein